MNNITTSLAENLKDRMTPHVPMFVYMVVVWELEVLVVLMQELITQSHIAFLVWYDKGHKNRLVNCQEHQVPSQYLIFSSETNNLADER